MPKHYRAQKNLILLATLILTLPALFSGLMGDDYLHYALLTADLPIGKPDDLSLFGLFSFINGDPERNRMLMDYSLIPWWTDAQMKYAFWRPLSEITHWLDYQLWPNQTWIMHLQSIAWYICAVYLLAAVYKQLNPNGSIAIVALFLYALDSTHGFTVSWISNRNALLSLAFGISAILLHIKWREQSRWHLLTGALICQLLALLSAELGISAYGYLVAYGLLLDKEGPIKGFMKTLPAFLVIVVWWTFYKYAGFGAAHANSYYIDPAIEPLGFLQSAVMKLPVLLASQWGIIPADLYTLAPPIRTLLAVTAMIFLLLVLFPIIVLQRKNRTALFYLAGMLCSIFPALAASPYDRLLLFPGIGAAGLLAGFLCALYDPSAPKKTVATGTMLVAYLMIALHLVIAPLLLPVMSYSTRWMAQAVPIAPSRFPEIEHIESKKLILFSTPLASSLALAAFRFYRHEPIPERIWTITTLPGSLDFTPEGNTLTITRQNGFLSNPIEETVRDLKLNPFKENEQVKLSGLSIEVEQLEDGKPRRLKLTFTDDVQNDEYVFLQWNNATSSYERIRF